MGGKRRSIANPVLPTRVASVLERYPPEARLRLLTLRALILATAADLDEVGTLTETLKWGEVSYLTEQSKSGTTIRVGWRKHQPDYCALFVSCNTTLVSDFRERLETDLVFEGNRALLIPLDGPLPTAPLQFFIQAALTYHLAPKRKQP